MVEVSDAAVVVWSKCWLKGGGLWKDTGELLCCGSEQESSSSALLDMRLFLEHNSELDVYGAFC